MKHLKKFNESDESFKNTNQDIELFFTDYTDENPDALEIKDGLIYDGRVIDPTTYMKDPSKYRKCKVITLEVGKTNGINTKNDGRCFTSFDILKNALADIERFYDLSGEEVNFTINTEYDTLTITFVTLGDFMKSEDTSADKIDKYMLDLKDIFIKRYKKRSKISGNWLDVRFSKADAKNTIYGDGSFPFKDLISKVVDGTMIDTRHSDLIDLKNRMESDGLKMKSGGGDNQLVVKIVKI